MSEISREAGTKGYRFQKLRACIRLLSAIAADSKKRVSCAIELLEDSFLVEESGTLKSEVEENKNYSSALTFNSEPVKNTIVAFIDLYFRFLADESINFCFFASTSTGEERFSNDIFHRTGLSPGSEGRTSILDKLSKKQPLSPDEEKLCKTAILDEYQKQYEKRPGGYLATIAKWTPEQFGEFLSKIEWTITRDGNDELEAQAKQAVRSSAFFNYRHECLDDLILSGLLDLFEKYSAYEYPVARLVNVADVELIFLKSLGSQPAGKRPDPAYGDWNSITTSDLRNLQEKIEAVTRQYPAAGMLRLNRRVALAKQEASTWEREYVSLRRRIFDVCEEILISRKISGANPVLPSEIDQILDKMVTESMDKLQQLSKSYHYQINDDETIRGAILSLFDECYLAFD